MGGYGRIRILRYSITLIVHPLPMTTKHLSTSLLTALCALNAASAASISYVGSVEDSTVNDWRTASTVKPMDADGDNIYGTHGAVHWTIVGVNEFGAGSASAGWHYGGEVSFGQFNNAAYAQIDNLSNPAVDAGGGIGAVQNPGAFDFEMTGVPETYAGRTLRIGVMADILTSGEWAADTNKTFQLVQTGGGTADSGVISLRGGAAGNGQPEMYFFDVTGVNAGNTFRLITGNSGASGQAGYLGPVAWDVYTPIPEPSVALLAGLAGIGLMRRRRSV